MVLLGFENLLVLNYLTSGGYPLYYTFLFSLEYTDQALEEW